MMSIIRLELRFWGLLDPSLERPTTIQHLKRETTGCCNRSAGMHSRMLLEDDRFCDSSLSSRRIEEGGRTSGLG